MITYWKGCNGELYTPGARCRKCGGTAADHIPAGLQAAELKRPDAEALELPVTEGESLFGPDCRLRVTITRGIGKNGPLDADNLAGGCKHLRDEITRKILGRKDDSEATGIEWVYRQKEIKGTLIEIEEVGEE